MITSSKTSKILDSVPITNNGKILGWMCDRSLVDYRTGRKSLMADLRNELTEIFGKHHATKTFEFKHKIWVLEYKDLVFNVYSASGKGTSIEICNFSYEDMHNRNREKDIISFLEELSDLLPVEDKK